VGFCAAPDGIPAGDAGYESFIVKGRAA